MCKHKPYCIVRKGFKKINDEIQNQLLNKNLVTSLKKFMDTLEIINLHAETNKIGILKGINLKIRSGEIHAIYGKERFGKSTLCNVIMGHPKYKINQGQIKLNGKKIEKLPTNKRANLGLFLAFKILRKFKESR